MLKEIPVVEQRYQAVLAVLEDGLSVTEVPTKLGMSGQTVHAWLSRYADSGLDGLADRSHRPRSCPHQMDPDVQVRLVELRQLHPTWGPDRLLYQLEREQVTPLPSRAARKGPQGLVLTRGHARGGIGPGPWLRHAHLPTIVGGAGAAVRREPVARARRGRWPRKRRR